MKIALILNDDFSMWTFRRNLISGLKERGHAVTIITPAGPYVQRLYALGARHIAVPMHRFVSPLQDVRTAWRLYRVCRKERFDIVHTMTIKPNVYGSTAARLAGVPHIVGLVSGLGFGFAESTKLRNRLVSRVVRMLYRAGNAFMERVWFQNADDLALFVRLGLLPRHKAVVIRSGGINLEEYAPDAIDSSVARTVRAELGLPMAEPIILMAAARLVWSKGVQEFVEAMYDIGRQGLPSCWVLAGRVEPQSPDAVPEQYLKKHESSSFRWVGFRYDLKQLMALAHVVVLPSYYPEGVPRTLLEALALAKPIITTDSTGCREVVDDGRNGFLVPPRDARALAKAVAVLLRDQDLRVRFGRDGREKAREFSDEYVVDRIISELYGLS